MHQALHKLEDMIIGANSRPKVEEGAHGGADSINIMLNILSLLFF